MSKINEWESLWATYVAKLARVDDLRRQGRYGYQLKQPRRAVQIAAQAIKDWDHANNERPLHLKREGGPLVWEGRP